MARRARVTTWYARHHGHVTRGGSGRALAIGRTVRALADADTLAGPSDFEAAERPVGRAWVRRVPGRNLWVWYRFTEDEVLLLAVTTEPPVPVDEHE